MGTEKFIDVEKIIASKNPGLLKWLPGFVLRWIKRVLHEDELNAFHKAHGHLRNHEFLAKMLSEFDVKVELRGLEHIPANGGFIIAANHPLGGFDGIALMHAVGAVRKDQRFLVNDILMNLTMLQDLFVPVNKHGSQHAADKIEEAYASENAVLVFPAGLVSRKTKEGIRDLDWKRSFIRKSVQYNKVVIPTYIYGRNTSWFYNLALWRKRLGIKANIEMFYLADEMLKQRGKTITIIFGRPIASSTFDSGKSAHHWADYVKSIVYAMDAEIKK
jgi:putative hemolysin